MRDGQLLEKQEIDKMCVSRSFVYTPNLMVPLVVIYLALLYKVAMTSCAR